MRRSAPAFVPNSINLEASRLACPCMAARRCEWGRTAQGGGGVLQSDAAAAGYNREGVGSQGMAASETVYGMCTPMVV